MKIKEKLLFNCRGSYCQPYRRSHGEESKKKKADKHPEEEA